MKINYTYPLIFQLDTNSRIKSLWLGWFLITWNVQEFSLGNEFRIGNYVVSVSFQPGL